MTFGISSTHKNTLFRARSAVLARDFELAIRLFKRLLQEFPDNLELLHELATTYIRSEQDEQAEVDTACRRSFVSCVLELLSSFSCVCFHVFKI